MAEIFSHTALITIRIGTPVIKTRSNIGMNGIFNLGKISVNTGRKKRSRVISRPNTTSQRSRRFGSHVNQEKCEA